MTRDNEHTPQVTRKAYVCKNCDGVYADQSVTKCDCMPEIDEFIEGAIIYPAAAPVEQDPVVFGRVSRISDTQAKIDLCGDPHITDGMPVYTAPVAAQAQPDHFRDAAKMIADAAECLDTLISNPNGQHPLRQQALSDAKGHVANLYRIASAAAPAQPWQQLAAALYQACGAYDMPVRVLDALSAAAHGEPFADLIDGLLPVESPAQKPVSGADGLPDEPEYTRAWQKHAALYGHDSQHVFTAGWNAAKDDMLSHCVESALHIAKEKLAQPQPSGADGLHDAARFACGVLSEIYTKHQVKIGPFASQAQLANVRLGHALGRAGQPQPSGNADPDSTMERALAELVDKIVPGLDTGDLLADAATASQALDRGQPSGNAGDLSHDLLGRVSDALGRFVSDEGWSQADMDLADEFAAALAAKPQPSGNVLPERDPATPTDQQGLFRKFDVRRADGSDAPGGKHHGCRYFVLDVDHDQHAQAALTAYAAACEATHPALAADLRDKWGADQPSGSAGELESVADKLFAEAYQAGMDGDEFDVLRAKRLIARAALAAQGGTK